MHRDDACLPAGKPAQEILSIVSILNLPGAEILARLRHLPLKPWRCALPRRDQRRSADIMRGWTLASFRRSDRHEKISAPSALWASLLVPMAAGSAAAGLDRQSAV